MIKKTRSRFFRFFSVLFCVLVFTAILGFCFIDTSRSPSLVNEEKAKACKSYANSSVIDVTKTLNIAVWNIYKLKKDEWYAELTKLANKNQLILLQEAISSLNIFSNTDWHLNQAYGFALLNDIAGVMTLSRMLPEKVCAYSQPEPIFRLPKTALLSFFPLSNGKKLAVANIHSINFTSNLTAFTQQVQNIVLNIQAFEGPIIFAGDFNTWSQARLNLLKTELEKIGLQQVSFMPDERLRVFGKALDHVFYRDLRLEKAQSKSTPASDHAFLEVNFRFN